MSDIADTLIEGGSIASPSGVHPGSIWIKDGRIAAIYVMRNPDKLTHV